MPKREQTMKTLLKWLFEFLRQMDLLKHFIRFNTFLPLRSLQFNNFFCLLFFLLAWYIVCVHEKNKVPQQWCAKWRPKRRRKIRAIHDFHYNCCRFFVTLPFHLLSPCLVLLLFSIVPVRMYFNVSSSNVATSRIKRGTIASACFKWILCKEREIKRISTIHTQKKEETSNSLYG